MGIFDRLALAIKAITDPRSIDPNYGTSLQIISPGQPVWTPKNYQNFVKEGYRRTASVYACINKIATTASGIKWKLYTDRTMKREIEEHPLLDLWRKPNLNESQGMFVEKLFGFWHLSGNDYIWAYRPQKNGPPMALWHLRPDRVKIVPSTIGIESYVYGYGTPGMKTYEPEDTLHIKFPAYDDDYYGLSPMETASQLIDQQNEGNAWNTALMQNAGKPASAFFAKGFLTDQARNQIKDELRRKYSGKRNAGMPLVLEGDMTWQNMSMSPYELDWLQSRELNTREIASIFDVAPELIGDSAGKTFANVAEARQALYTENVLPKMDRVVDHVNNWLVPMYDDLKGAYFTYDKEDIEALASLYQAALTAKSERATNLYNTTQCTLDEAREMQNLPPLPQGKGKVFKIVGPTILVSADEIDEYADQSMDGPKVPPPAIAELPPDAQQQLPPAGGTSASQQGQNNNAAPANNRNGNTDNNDDKQSNKRIIRYKGNGDSDEDEEGHTGIMIALFLDKKSAKKLTIPDGEPASDLHITLAYIKDEDNPDLDIPALKKLLTGYASEAIPLEGTTSGVGRFSPSDHSDGLSPVWAAVNISGLQKWRADLVKQLEASDITIASNFDYQPHITLAYIDPDDPMPINDVPELDLSFDELWLCIGDDRYSFPIGDEQYPEKRVYRSLYRKTNQEANYKVWKCAPDACEFCMQNDGKMVAIDATFPNGCSAPSDCHKFCKCTASTLYIPDDVDQSHVSNWGFATLAAAYGVALLASRHDKDVAAQREKEQENTGKYRGIIDHDQKYKKALQIFTVDDRYLRMRSLPIRTETSTQERHYGLSGDSQQTTKAATRALIGTASKADISPTQHYDHTSRRRKRARSAYRDFMERYI